MRLIPGMAIVNFDDDLQRLRILKIIHLRQRFELDVDVQKPTEGEYMPKYLRTREARPLTSSSFHPWGSGRQMLQDLPDLPLEPEYAHLITQVPKPTSTTEAGETTDAKGMAAAGESRAMQATTTVEVTGEASEARDPTTAQTTECVENTETTVIEAVEVETAAALESTEGPETAETTESAGVPKE